MTTPTDTDHTMIARVVADANAAIDAGGTGIAALLRWHDDMLAAGCNAGRETGDATAHAEMVVLRAAARRLAQLGDADKAALTLYTTLEPCLMCLSAISLAGVRRVVWSASNADANERAWIAHGVTTEQINPLLVRGPLVLVPNVAHDAGVALLQRMSMAAEQL